jgi:DNA mismatch repair protein MutS
MSLIKEYFELTKRYQDEYGENTILLMQVGSFFEVYGIYNAQTEIITKSKIVCFSQICELNIVEKNTCVGNDNVMMAGFKDMQIEKYIKKIQDAGYTAVVYTQDEAAKNTTRSLAGIFSPGTYFHTETQNLTNSTTCIWIDLVENKILMKGKYVVVGIANIDIYTGKTNIFQFKETYANNPTTYDELERFISIYNPSETILITNLPDINELDYIISYAGISSSLIHKIHISSDDNIGETSEKMLRVKKCEKQPYQKEVLSKFYKFDNYDTFIQNFYEQNIATQSFCFLLDFIYQHNPHLVNKISEPIFENCSTRLSLANHSLKQLNIINDGNVKQSKYSCVSQMLNDCLTQMGKRKFMYNILNPICNENVLQREYDITEHFLSKYEDYNNFLKSTLSTIKDISKIERQIFLKKISPKTFYNLYNNILTIKQIYEKVEQDIKIKEYLYVFEPTIFDIKIYCDQLAEFINNNIDLSEGKNLDQLQNFEINFIKNGIDEELDKKTLSLKESECKLTAISEYLSSLIENKEKKSGKATDYVKIHETEKNSFSLLTTSRRCKLLQDALPNEKIKVSLNYIITINNIQQNKSFSFEISKKLFDFEKQSASNNFIVNDDITNLCRNISNIKISMKDLITLVYNKFVVQFEQYQTKIDSIINFVTIIDMIYTKASIAKKYNYCKPTIVKSDKSFVDAKKLRHCLIETFQSSELYVTNDIILGDNKGNNKTDGILLYGTNAVGKTTIIRALGISIIMAQAGLYVPCSEFNYMPYKYIFTRIIGNDNIFKGLSTFAVEMSELRTILRLTNENSLILGDELCSGTETQSAISIFVAGIQQLHKCKSSFIFATHLHEIVDYDEITGLESVKLKHMSVVYDREKDALVYDRKLKEGPGNSMYGLEVCKSLNLPQDFIDNAYEIRMKYHPEARSLLSLKTSRYNSKKIMGLCEKCGKNMGTEVHHLQHQASADTNGFITELDCIFHKNNLANLMTLCEKCHNAEHSTAKKGEKRVKTTKGTKIKEI